MLATMTFSNEFLDTPIHMYDTDLSVRAKKGLGRVHMTVMRDIFVKWDTLNRIRGIGINTVNEIKNFFINVYICQASDEELRKFFASLLKSCNEKEYASLMYNLIELELQTRE